MKNRIASHKKDFWYSHGEWKIDYSFVESECDVQFLEGWLIAFYGTGKYYNIAKTSWGTSKMFSMPTLAWCEFSGDVIPKKSANGRIKDVSGKGCISPEEHRWLLNRIRKLEALLNAKQKECSELKRQLGNQRYVIDLKSEEIERAKRKLDAFVRDSAYADDTKTNLEFSKKVACVKGSSSVFRSRVIG